MEIIKAIKETDDSLPVLSWFDKKYGRIYAQVCNAPLTLLPNQLCADGGTTFYDSNGKILENCWGGPRIVANDDSFCNYMATLRIEDADYKEVESCAKEFERIRQSGEGFPAKCCAGLKAVMNKGYNNDCSISKIIPSGDIYMCINCGDGNCYGEENKCNCPQDCK